MRRADLSTFLAYGCFGALLALPRVCLAQTCPGPDASLKAVTDAISDLQSNGRAPAGADCAHGWASGYDLSTSDLDTEVLRFFRAATDVQRKASEMRRTKGKSADANLYLDQEIELRQAFLTEAIRRDSPEEVSRLKPDVVRHLSYLSSALAYRGQYKQIADSLGDKDPGIVDTEALKVWLQAVWSCAQWDGNKRNPCSDPDRQTCKAKVQAFLTSLDEMGARKLPPQTKTDIDQLRPMVATGGCLATP